MSGWTAICPYERIEPERGVAALVAGAQIAIFRTHDGELLAISNFDPYGRANVLSRGIVGSRGGAPTVASPIFKQVFDLRTGACLDQPDVVARIHPVRCREGTVEVGWPR